MSDGFIPEERLPAFHRWQLASFDAPAASSRPDPAAAAETHRLHEQSRNMGYAAGYQEGRRQAEQEAQQLHTLVQNARAALSTLDQAVADQLLALALDIARQMLGQALAIRPALVLPIIEEAVRCVSQSDEPIHVHVHPEDARLLRNYLEAWPGKEWIVVDDVSVQRGGCRIDTRSTEADATLQGRWRRVLANLGSSDEWLRP